MYFFIFYVFVAHITNTQFRQISSKQEEGQKS